MSEKDVTALEKRVAALEKRLGLQKVPEMATTEVIVRLEVARPKEHAIDAVTNWIQEGIGVSGCVLSCHEIRLADEE